MDWGVLVEGFQVVVVGHIAVGLMPQRSHALCLLGDDLVLLDAFNDSN